MGERQKRRHLRSHRSVVGHSGGSPKSAKFKMWLEVDGHRFRNGSTHTMVFGVRFLISYLTRFMSLQPGDVITTGPLPESVWARSPRSI